VSRSIRLIPWLKLGICMFANMSDSVAAVRLQDVLAGLLNESDAQPVTLTSSTVGNTEDDEWLVDLLKPPPAKTSLNIFPMTKKPLNG